MSGAAISPPRRAGSFLRLWLLTLLAYAVAKTAVDFLNFGRLISDAATIGELIAIPTLQAAMIYFITRRPS
jgi:hypothetical protein